MRIKNIALSTEKIFYVVLLLYLVTMNSFQVGTGLDPIIKKISFGLLIMVFVINFKNIQIKKTTLYLVLFWFFYFSSLLWASNVDYVIDYLNVAVYTILLSVVISSYITDTDDIMNVMKVIICSLIITIVILLIRTPLQSLGSERIGDALGIHPNSFGSKMAYGSLISLFLFHNSKNKEGKKNIICLFLMLVFIGFTILSGSKLAIFVSLIGIILYEVLITKGFSVFLKTAVILIMVYGMYTLIMNNSTLYNLIGYRIETFFMSLSGVSANTTGDFSTYEREFYINKAIELFKINPIIGYGGNNFRAFMGEISYSHITYSHNNYLEMLSTLGLIGFILYYYPWIKNLIQLLFSKSFKIIDKYKLKYLFIILFSVKLIADFATISYMDEFVNVIFTLGLVYISLVKNDEHLRNI